MTNEQLAEIDRELIDGIVTILRLKLDEAPRAVIKSGMFSWSLVDYEADEDADEITGIFFRSDLVELPEGPEIAEMYHRLTEKP